MYRERQDLQTWDEELSPAPQSVNWWLRLTSSGWQHPQRTIEQRELARRSRLAAWIILGLLVMIIALIPGGFSAPSTLITLGVAAVLLIIAAALNRAGLVNAAGSLLVLMVIGGVFGSITGASADQITGAQAGELGLIYLPAWDLLVIAVIVGASILPRWAAFVIAGVNSTLIYVNIAFQMHAADLQKYVNGEGILPLIARPVALQIIVAVVAFLWVRGTDQAIRRADRAEEIAAMEHRLLEQKRQLEYGIEQILQTHVRVANGDFGARAPLTQDNVLFQIASSLNNLLNRLGRAAQSEYGMQRTMLEIQRLRDSLLAARSGRTPLWPAPSGTPVDMLLEVLAGPVRSAGPQQPGMAPIGAPAAFGGTSGPLIPPAQGRIGNYGTPPGAYDQRRPDAYYPAQPGQPGQPGPFSGPQGGPAFPPFQGNPQTGAFRGPPGQPPSTAGLGGFAQPGRASGPFGPDGAPSYAPAPPAASPAPPSAWDMPPLPDLPEDPSHGQGQ